MKKRASPKRYCQRYKRSFFKGLPIRLVGIFLRFSLVLVFWWELSCVAAVAAQKQGSLEKVGGKIIQKVIVRGNKLVAEGVILAQVRSRAGSVFNEAQVGEDARRITLMPEIYNAGWEVKAADGKVEVIFTVTESPQVKKIILIGNKNITTKKLLEKIEFKEGDFLDRYLVQMGIEKLVEAYHDKGYYFVTVTLNEELLKKEHEVSYMIVEGSRLRVKKVKFEGNESISSFKLKGKVKTKSYFPIFRKGKLDDEQLEQDRLALINYFHDEGYLDAQVAVFTKFNDDKTRVTVRFVIEEGVKYLVAAVRFEGNKAIPSEELLSSINLDTGKVLTQKRRIFAQRAVKRAYGKEGYIYTQVDLDLQYTQKQGEVDAVFKIEENQKYYLDRLIIRGNHQTKDKVIRRDFDRHGFLPGTIYNTDAADRAKTRLKGAGLFEELTITPTGTAADKRDAIVEVTETRTGLFTFGAGVDTNSGVMGQISLEQQNFDISKWPRSLSELFQGESFVGGGQRLRLDFYPGTRVTRGRINFHEPYLFDLPYYLDVDLFIFRRWREAYLERRRGGNVTLGHRFDNDWFVDLSLRAENIQVSGLDDAFRYSSIWGENRLWGIFDSNLDYLEIAPYDIKKVEGNNFLTSLKLGVGRNTTDRIFKPTEGYKINASWEQVGALGGEFYYAALGAGGTLYKTVYMDITERKTVWAGQIRGSKIIGDAPVFERYYAGGIGSIRGFDYRGVSPQDSVAPLFPEYPVGSQYILLAGTELTHPLYEETLFGKVFCDTGMVSEGPYRVAVGFGVEIVVPQLFRMIPMHFDFGFPLISDDKDDEELFSFTFGLNF